MKYLILSTLLAMNAQMVSAKEFLSNEKGNGGDAVICNGRPHTLDSVIMMEERYFDITREERYEVSIAKIKNHLNNTLPLMGQTLGNFLQNFKAKGNVEEGVFWVKGRLKNIADENLYIEIPSHCENEAKQVVVLVKSPFKRYYYDANLIEELSQNGDELSWLLIHEWLRNYVDDSDVIRIINAYLHSEQFLNSNEEEVQETIERLGVTSGYGPLSSEERASTERLKVMVSDLEKRLNEIKSHIEKFSSAKTLKEKKKIYNFLVIESGRLETGFYIALVGESASIDRKLKEKLESLYSEKTRVVSDIKSLKSEIN